MDLIKNNKRESLSIIAAISVTFGAYFLFKSSKSEKKGFRVIPEPANKLPIVGN